MIQSGRLPKCPEKTRSIQYATFKHVDRPEMYRFSNNRNLLFRHRQLWAIKKASIAITIPNLFNPLRIWHKSQASKGNRRMYYRREGTIKIMDYSRLKDRIKIEKRRRFPVIKLIPLRPSPSPTK